MYIIYFQRLAAKFGVKTSNVKSTCVIHNTLVVPAPRWWESHPGQIRDDTGGVATKGPHFAWKSEQTEPTERTNVTNNGTKQLKKSNKRLTTYQNRKPSDMASSSLEAPGSFSEAEIEGKRSMSKEFGVGQHSARKECCLWKHI